jgi:hypothetical protein
MTENKGITNLVVNMPASPHLLDCPGQQINMKPKAFWQSGLLFFPSHSHAQARSARNLQYAALCQAP